ncbi:hydro-lyase, Fe-S type, tartrate/fumarate subfamily, beta subunit [Ruminiclostridium papyrosolvens DSM 2782]|uniref:Hydro-lyase, Fe-S type, tartrate/fumarate subfamily, beta subunit n=1 Tax=Ruminiclostridium papyrosolvens DSM 2782 TaxID=588581 RepID=F1TGJ7_9FIRM|nr:Fe-S-containing hydro-lyase [Ruminiclostridium papyrosolvens]EGD46562.1 hydro-lyase, Fe-S type, tartrate/fumarate subfamily, beta subunit [Ruminiclostridium papyrosolvens DSM 2782]WES35292.1 Fe-S-containing hydro-lyase [Ruminiclostridium papyrosolvens DSM 2782]
MHHILTAPFDREKARMMKAGDTVSLSGTIYTARDAAHKKMLELLKENKELPFDIKNQTIYYVGPCPCREGEIIGSAGPTTSYRMDAYAPTLISLGETGMIGKGLRDRNVIDAMKEYGAVYLGAIGGAGALMAECIKSQEIIAFPELGAEAVRRLEIVNFPLTVIIDSCGNNLYESGRKQFMKIKL